MAMVFGRDYSGDGVTGDGGYGEVTGDKIFTGDITGDKIVTGEAFSPVKEPQKVMFWDLDT